MLSACLRSVMSFERGRRPRGDTTAVPRSLRIRMIVFRVCSEGACHAAAGAELRRELYEISISSPVCSSTSRSMMLIKSRLRHLGEEVVITLPGAISVRE